MSNLSNNFDNTNLSVYTASLIKSTLFDDKSFLTKFTDVTSYLQGRYVNFPFYTNSTVVTVNGSTFSADAVSQTQQTSKQMVTSVYRANATLITAFEGEMLNFDKAQIELTSQIAGLEDAIANEVIKTLVLGTDASRVVLTTGANGIGNKADGTSNAKKLVYADFLSLKKKMDLDNVAGERYLLLDAELFSEVLSDEKLSSYLQSSFASVVSGEYPKIAGINLINKANTAAMSSSGAVKIPGVDTMIASDTRVALAWVGDAVGYAYGTPNIYSATSPQHYGVVQSVEAYLACSNLRLDDKGVYIIKQG